MEAIVALLEHPAPNGTIFNIGGERPILHQDLQDLIAEEMEIRRYRFAVPTWFAGPAVTMVDPILTLLGRPRPNLRHFSWGGVVSSAVDDRRFRRRYPNVPVTQLRKGLREHIQWARSDGLLAGEA